MNATELPLDLIAVEAATDLAVGTLLMGLLGGLAIFLFGLDLLTDSLKAIAGERLKLVLAKLTTNRFMGAATGAFITAVIQSSSVTTVLVVGFITSGLMTLTQAIGVIMGANVGTTITAQIIAFKVTKYALGITAAGFAFYFFSRRERIRQHGGFVFGLGLVFLGMTLMGEAMEPLRTYAPFVDWMTRLQNPLIGIAIGALLTALIQSSSATIAIVIVLAAQGLVSLPAGIALTLGANVGTSMTAALAAIGKPREAIRASVFHVLFKVFSVLLWIAFIDQLADFVTRISPSSPDLIGFDRLAAETPRQIANAHTVFNVANTLLFIGFVTPFAKLVTRLVPDRPEVEDKTIKPRYLSAVLISTPSLALDRARLEILHLGNRVRDMYDAILPALLKGTREELDSVKAADEAVDDLHGYIIEYLGKVSQQSLTTRETSLLFGLIEATNDIENIGDLIETNLVGLGRDRREALVTISPETTDVITHYHSAVAVALDSALQAIAQGSEQAALHVIGMKKVINSLNDSAAVHQMERLVADEPNRLRAYKIEMDILATLKRVYYFTKRMARIAISAEASRDE